jgi:2-methylcitrate dehydratase PrpD
MMTTSYTKTLSAYIAKALSLPLPDAVVDKTKIHILDTLAACVSGAHLEPGKQAISFVQASDGHGPATVIATRIKTSVEYAALANGMMAHADETDDSHAPSLTHPGCGVVPAALAAAEKFGASGTDFIRAVALGYDVCARMTMALGADRFMIRGFSSHATGSLWGAAAAAAALARLNARQCAVALSYTAQQASGIAAWRRDPDHVEKAFDFSGMAARNGVSSVLMVAHGMTGVDEVLDGDRNYFAAYQAPYPDKSIDRLGEKFEILDTAIKRWCVGSPIQAALDATEVLIAKHALTADKVDRIEVELATEASKVVDRRAMPDVNLQHMVALMLVDGTVTFASSHDVGRMRDAEVVAMTDRIKLIPSAELERAQPSRQAKVAIHAKDGKVHRHHALDVRGTPANPMTRQEVVDKAIDLMVDILGPQTDDLIRCVLDLELQKSITLMASLLRA